MLSIIVPLFTTPYVNRILGPHGIGINTFTNTIVQYFILAGSLGISIYGNREIAYYRDNKEKRSQIFCEIQALKFIGITIATVIYFIFLSVYSKYKIYLLVQYINLLAAAFDISWFFQGLENFKVTVIRNTIVKLISVALIFILIHDKNDLILYMFLLSFSVLAGNITLWFYLKKEISLIRRKRLNPWIHFLPSLGLFVPQIALQVYQALNKTILGICVSTNASGYYYNSDTVIKMVLSLVTAIGTVMLPHTAYAYAKGRLTEIKKITYLSSNITTCLTFAFAFGIASISLKFAPIFFGGKFITVGPAMMIEAPVIYFAGVSGVLGTQYLLPTKQAKSYSNSLIFGAALSIVLNFLLIPAFGLQGAMFATVIAEFGVMTYQLIVVIVKNKQLSARMFFKDTFKYFFAGVVMFSVVFLIDRSTPSKILFIFLETLVGVIVYLLMLLVQRTEATRLILEKVHQKWTL